MKSEGSQWRFAVDRGGTFTDVIGLDPKGNYHTLKLLSSSPDYQDASIEGIRRLLGISKLEPLPADRIEAIRLGTTVATNALLERKGGAVALFITRGFADLLEIGYQSRPDIFSLCIRKPALLYSRVFEIEERVDSHGEVIRELDPSSVQDAVRQVKEAGINTIAVVFLHSWRNPRHELHCEEIIQEAGLSTVFLSHRTSNLIKVVTRGQGTVVNAYLSPVLFRYLSEIRKETGDIPVAFIQSSGNLRPLDELEGKEAILSGPAGGVNAVAGIAEEMKLKGAIGFDMGGTSTDVSRYDGELERLSERTIGGIELQTEMLNIVTIASGGGSVLWFDGQKMRVGPQSAGALPGPACYGFGGPLTITDANLITGRVLSQYLPKTFGPQRNRSPDLKPVEKAFQILTDEINRATGREMSPHETALGFIRIANEKMAMAIKEISLSKGFDVRDYALLCFGGAAGQHACQVASILDIEKIIYHPFSGVLSAYGIGLANPSKRSVRTILQPYNLQTHTEIEALFENMIEGISSVKGSGKYPIRIKKGIDLRHAGSETSLTVVYSSYKDIVGSFQEQYTRLFGFYPEDVPLEVVTLRVEAIEESDFFSAYSIPLEKTDRVIKAETYTEVSFGKDKEKVPVFLREFLPREMKITGPAFVVDRHSAFLIEEGFDAEVENNGTVTATKRKARKVIKASYQKEPDPVLLEVFNNLFMGIASEMGHTLRNTAHSVNIKERLDFSCALFDSKGDLVANAPHIPVHLGAMADTVKAILADHGETMMPGDMYLTNNPYRGGSHLPDITVVCPVFSGSGEILFFTGVRGHHADIGGITPGSMPPKAKTIEEEGVLLDGMLLVREGNIRENALSEILSSHTYPVRNINERISDLRAEVAACHKGEKELQRIIRKYGWPTVHAYMGYIQENAEFSIKKALAHFLELQDPFISTFRDFLDDGTELRVKVTITGGPSPPHTTRAIVDFTGTGPYHRTDNLNAPLSVTRSCVLYGVRALTGESIPLNSGCLKPIEIIVPKGTLLNPPYPAPVASGNVETSQRVVDAILGSLQVAGASQGTMNNLLFEVEGETPYYETIGGGSGALDGCPGASGVQVHMTNTRITDPEILEFRHPGIRLERFTLRRGSGGKGLFSGGEGVIRELKFLKPAAVSILSERRTNPPYGMNGGEPGRSGKNLLKKSTGEMVKLPNRTTIKVRRGDSITIKTPGGGGFGRR